MSAVVDRVAMVEALRDAGLDDAEIAVELGCDVAELLPGDPEPVEEEVVAPAPPRAAPERRRFEPAPATIVPRGDPERMSRAGSRTRAPDSPDNRKVSLDSEMGTLVKVAALDRELVSWTSEDDARTIHLCDAAVSSPGRPAVLKLHGRTMSRACLVRLLAEEMCRVKLKKDWRAASLREQETLIGLAGLMVTAIDGLSDAETLAQ